MAYKKKRTDPIIEENEKLKRKKLALMIAARRKVRDNYLKYVEFTNFSMNDDARWLHSRHLDYLCTEIQKFIETDTGHPYDVLILNLPPQHGKSISITETLPSWYMGKHPDDGVILAAYGDSLSQRFGRRNKEKIDRFGKLIFDISISQSKSANDDFEIEGHKGRCISRGILGGITGNPAKLIVVDDPVATKEDANSPTMRDKVWGEWESSIRNRAGTGCKIILIMTRWHDDDLAGRILKYEKNVTHINLTCEAEENDVLGREVGDGLFPEIGKGRDWKDQMKAAYILGEGFDAWMSMFQGQPVLASGNIFKRDWFKFYKPENLPVMQHVVLSVDATFKDTKKSDFVAIGAWGKCDSSVYLLDIVNERMDFNRTLEVIRELKKKHPQIGMLLIEDKANGSAIISTLRHEIMGIVPVEPLGSKESRAYAIQPFVMAGNVYLPEGLQSTEEYIDQMVRFPKGSHDDMVDMTSQALVRLKDFVATGAKQEQPKQPFAAFNKPKSVLQNLSGFKVGKSFINY